MATKISEAITIHVISRDPELTKRLVGLADSYEQEPGSSCRVSSVEQLPAEATEFPRLIVIDLDSMPDETLAQIPRFRQQGGRSWIAVTSKSSASERLLKAMRVGANDFMPSHPTMEEFQDLLERVILSQGDGAGRTKGRLVSVFSNKGGVGTTTVAINVAASLAAQLRGAVVVVDLVLQHGDLSVFLDVPTTYTIVNLITELDRTDASYLRSVLPRHASGVYVLPAPYVPDEVELVSATQVTRLLQKLCATFDIVVVDAGNEFNDYTLAALDASDRLLLVTLPDLASVRNSRRSLELFGRLHYDPSKIVVVLNRHDAKEPLSRQTIEEALGRPVHWTIPNDYLAVVRAINQGTTLRLVQPKGALSMNLDKLAATHVFERAAGVSAAVRPSLRAGTRAGAIRTFFRRFGHGTS